MIGESAMRAQLVAGAVQITLSVLDYAYGPTATDSDASWLQAYLEVETPEVAARKPCFLFASALSALRDGVGGLQRAGPFIFENLEHDFRLAFQHDVDGVGIQATIWLSAGAEGQILVGATSSYDGIQCFLAALDDIISVYPPRG